MKMSRPSRVALLLNGSKHFDRQIIAGIGAHLAEASVAWEVFIEEDFKLRLAGIERLRVDGIIANFDDPAVPAALAHRAVPVVAVGGSYGDPLAYIAGITYVVSDNVKLVRMAFEHLQKQGLRHFALFGPRKCAGNRWAREREEAFRTILARADEPVHVFHDFDEGVAWSDAAMKQLSHWIGQLPLPVGIIAVSDTCARQLKRVCMSMGIRIPEQVALVGTEDAPLTGDPTQIDLSSVMHGAHEMGRVAARTLDTMLHGAAPADRVIVVPPLGIKAAASSSRDERPDVVKATVLGSGDQRIMLGRLGL
jgi:LacI family transcriptional regulator